MRNKIKRFFAMFMSVLMVISGVFSGSVWDGLVSIVSKAAENAPTATASDVEDLGTAIVQEAMKYLGKGYSQASNRGPNTYDCSGLVYTVLKNVGFSESSIPGYTDAWETWFNNPQSLVYDGEPIEIVTAGSIADYTAKINDSANAGKMVVLTSKVTASDLAQVELKPGSIIVGDGHASIVADTVEPDMSTLVSPTKFDTSVGQFAVISQTINQINYQKRVYEYFREEWGIQSIASVPARLVSPSDAELQSQQNTLNTLGYGNSYNYTRMMAGYNWTKGAAYNFSTAQDFYLQMNLYSNTNLAYKGYGGIGSTVWKIEALSPSYGVALTNNLGGKTVANAPVRIGTFVVYDEYYARLGIQKVQADDTNTIVSGAVYAVADNMADLNTAVDASSKVTSAKSAETSINNAEYESRVGAMAITTGNKINYCQMFGPYNQPEITLYVKEAYCPDGYTKDTTVYTVDLKGTVDNNGIASTIQSVTSSNNSRHPVSIIGGAGTGTAIRVVEQPDYKAALSMQKVSSGNENLYVGGAGYVLIDYTNMNTENINKIKAAAKTAAKEASANAALTKFLSEVKDKKIADDNSPLYQAGRIKGFFVTSGGSALADMKALKYDGANSRYTVGNTSVLEFGSDKSKKYGMIEIYTPSGYFLDENFYTFTLNANGNMADDFSVARSKSTISGLAPSGGQFTLRNNTSNTTASLYISANDMPSKEYEVVKEFAGEAGDRVDSVTVELYADGKPTGMTVALSKSNNWHHTWTGLESYTASGSEIVYSAKEIRINGSSDMDGFEVETVSDKDKTVITNSLLQLYGQIRIEKVNSELKTVKIAGVQYKVYADAACEKELTTITTNADGIAVYTVPTPWYKLDGTAKTVYIKEFETVSPYKLDDTVYCVVIRGSEESAEESICDVTTVSGTSVGTRITQFAQENNEQYGQITVIKEGENLAGFTPGRWTDESNFVFQNGVFNYEYESMAGAVFTVTAKNEISNQAGTVNYTAGQTVATLTTGADGKASVNNLPLGIYTVTEIYAPEGQTLNRKTWDVTISYGGQTAEIVSQEQTVQNEKGKAAVTVIKVDSITKNGLANAVFGLYAKSDILKSNGEVVAAAGTLLATATTNAEGSGSFDIDIPYGEYTVRELRTRDGYVLSDEVYNFLFQYEGQDTYQYNFSHTYGNERMSAEIEVYKIDEKTGLAVPEGDAAFEGAVYELFAKSDIVHPDGHTGIIYKAGELVATLTLDAQGHAGVSGLYLGSYFVQEKTAPEGYLLDTDSYDLIVGSDGVNHVATASIPQKNTQVIHDETAVRDYPIERPIALIKLTGNGTEKEWLNGAGFSLYRVKTLSYKEDGTIDFDMSPKMVIGPDGETELFTHDVYNEDGDIELGGYLETIAVPYGDYILHETTVPHNKLSADDITVSISKDDTYIDANGNAVTNKTSTKTYRNVFDGDFVAKIKVIKKDLTTGNTVRLAGTTFRIYDVTRDVYVEETYIENSQKVTTDVFATNAEGILVMPNTLEAGVYRIEEQLAPEGYYNSELAEGIQSQFEITVDMDFVFEGSNVDEFYDADLGCYILPVYYYDEAVRGQIEVHKTGSAVVGYDTGTQSFIYEDIPLAGAYFEVFAEGDIYSPDHQVDAAGNRTLIYADGALVGTIVTGTDGRGLMQDLPLGTYRIVESKAPYGYLLDNDTVHYATLAYEGQLVAIVSDSDGVENAFYNNRPIADIQVTKYERDEEGNTVYDKPLAGTTFALLADEDIKNYRGEVIVNKDTVIETATTGDNGIAVFRKDIPFGVYKLVETQVTPGYVLDTTPVSVKFAYADQYTGVISIRAERANEYIKVDISKLDITGSEEVEGAHVQVIDSNGNVIEDWISGKEVHRINRLAEGTYILREVTAPTEHGFVKAQDIIFNVMQTGTVQSVIMYDDHTELHIGKQDFVTGEPVIGATLQLIAEEGSLFAEWETDGTEKVLEYIPVGKYTLREIIPASGYATAEEVQIEVREVGSRIEIQKAEMLDKPLIAQFSKTDAVTGKEVIGAKITIYKANENLEKTDLVAEWITDGEPHTISRLEQGTYIMVETEVPYGYQQATEVVFEITDTDEIQKVEMVDERTYGRLILDKVNDDGQPLAGVTFEIRNTLSGEVAETLITDENGHAESGLLPIDEMTENGLVSIIYEFSEIQTINGYVMDDTVTEVVFEYVDKDTPVIEMYYERVNHKQRGRIAVMKKGLAATGTTEIESDFGVIKKLEYGYIYLPGVKFTIYADPDLTQEILTIETSAEGLAVSDYLEVGTYYLKETFTPDGYVPDETVYEVEIEGTSDGVEFVLDTTRDIVNRPCSSTINIYKLGLALADNGDGYKEEKFALEGVYFGVYAAEDISTFTGEELLKADDMIAVLKTNSEGVASLTEALPAGNYYYKELKTLDSFILDRAPYAFEVSLENDDVTVEVNKDNPLINNPKSGVLTIHKVDQNGNPLGAGVEFELTCAETGMTWRLVTDANGDAFIDELPIGSFFDGVWTYYN